MSKMSKYTNTIIFYSGVVVASLGVLLTVLALAQRVSSIDIFSDSPLLLGAGLVVAGSGVVVAFNKKSKL